MKRTICKHCNPKRETIIGVETHCSECGTPLITILNKNNEKLIVKIGNETHESPDNGEVFSFEVEERYVPKDGDGCWVLGSFLQPRFLIYNSSSWFFKQLEKGLIFPTEAECQKFADHCLKYFDKK